MLLCGVGIGFGFAVLGVAMYAVIGVNDEVTQVVRFDNPVQSGDLVDALRDDLVLGLAALALPADVDIVVSLFSSEIFALLL